MSNGKILTEDDIETGLVGFLVGTWNYRHVCACPWGTDPCHRARLDDGTGRDSKKQVVLPKILRQKLIDLNPQIPEAAIDKVVGDVLEYHGGDGTSLTLNRRLYNELREGRVVEFEKDGESESDRLRFFDFDDPLKNDFCAVRQMWINGVDDAWRRPDVILFVNGLPLVFVELKNADVKVEAAYAKNLRDYREKIPNLFAYNQVCVLSNGTETRVGGFASGYEHFFEWLKVEEGDARVDRAALRAHDAEYAGCSLEYLAKGLFEPRRLLDYVENFILFDGTEGAPVKILAKTHQYLGVNAAVGSVRRREELKGRLGVFFHTQGSGKSYSMVFLARKVMRKVAGDFSFVVVTDRENLDTQIGKTFKRCGVVKEKDPFHPGSAEKLREALRKNNLFTFTLIQKFRNDPGREYPVLSERRDVIVIVDEAHRTQYEDLAANMRAALPNASFIAFTGTPLGKTGEWFGQTVSEYNFADAIADGSTVPIYYSNAAPQVEVCKNMLDSEVDEIGDAEGLALDEKERLEKRFAAEIEVLTRQERVADNARKIVEHFVNREYRGKGMVVAVDRYTAVRYYNEVRAYWKTYRSELAKRKLHETDPDELARLKTAVEYMDRVEMAVVISEDADEEAQFAKRGIEGIREIRARINQLDADGADVEDNFKNPENPLSLVFVCAMWLTGTDIPCLSTMYLDKPMKGHTLMQTIARVNRVYPGKHHGLIVDFVNIFKYVKKALGVYAKGGAGAELPVKPVDELIAALNKSAEETAAFLKEIGADLDVVCKMSKGQSFDKVTAFNGFLDTIVSKDDYRNRFFLFTNKLSQIWDASKPEVFEHRKELSPYLSPALYLRKMFDARADRSRLENAVTRLARNLDDRVSVKPNVVATGDLKEIDLSKLEISGAVARLKQVEYKNLVIDDLRKVVEEELRKLLKKNVTRAVFSEMYQRVIDSYNAGTAESEQAFEDLMKLLKEMKDEEKRAEREHLTDQQLEIYDILCQGKRLTAAQEKAAKLAAVGLVQALTEHKGEVFTEEWFKYQPAKESVFGFICDTLAGPLEGYFDHPLFATGSQGVYNLFLDRAISGEEVLHVA